MKKLTEQQRYEFCKRCLNKKSNLETGIYCGLTDKKPAFIQSCKDFKHNLEYRDFSDRTHIGYSAKELKKKIPEKQYERLLKEQNFSLALIAGLVVALICTVSWAMVAFYTHRSIEALAVAIGMIISFTIKFVGRGIESKFVYLGVSLCVLSCYLGSFLGLIALIAVEETVGIFDVLYQVPILDLMLYHFETTALVEYVYYTIALSQALVFSTRRISAADINKMNNPMEEV